MPWRSPTVASARRQMMAVSLSRCCDAGASRPREACTAPIESSTVTNCSPVCWMSRSERPRVGRIRAVSPVTVWLRFSLVDTCTVKPTLRMAASVTPESEVARTKLPPTAKNTLTRPLRIARTLSTTSRPGSRGGSKPNSAPNASRKL